MSILRRSLALAARRLFFITFSGTGLQLLLLLLLLKLSLLDFRFRLLLLLWLLLSLFDEVVEPAVGLALEPFVLLLTPPGFL